MRRLRSVAFKILALLEFECSVQKHAIQTNKVNKNVNGDAKPTKSPFHWGHVDPIYYTHAVTDPTHLLQRQLDRCTHFRTTTQQGSHWLQWDAQIHPKLPLPFDNNRPHLIHPSFDRPHSPSQTAFGSTQPFCHSTLSGHTETNRHRPTDGIRTVRSLAILIETH